MDRDFLSGESRLRCSSRSPRGLFLDSADADGGTLAFDNLSDAESLEGDTEDDDDDDGGAPCCPSAFFFRILRASFSVLLVRLWIVSLSPSRLLTIGRSHLVSSVY